jgi:hypothetical protein
MREKGATILHGPVLGEKERRAQGRARFVAAHKDEGAAKEKEGRERV